MAKFIGELASVSTKTSKKGQTETVITFRVDNDRYGKLPAGIMDCQGLPCMVEIEQQKEEDEAAAGEAGAE